MDMTSNDSLIVELLESVKDVDASEGGRCFISARFQRFDRPWMQPQRSTSITWPKKTNPVKIASSKSITWICKRFSPSLSRESAAVGAGDGVPDEHSLLGMLQRGRIGITIDRRASHIKVPFESIGSTPSNDPSRCRQTQSTLLYGHFDCL